MVSELLSVLYTLQNVMKYRAIHSLTRIAKRSILWVILWAQKQTYVSGPWRIMPNSEIQLFDEH